jgi:hypothetical protein
VRLDVDIRKELPMKNATRSILTFLFAVLLAGAAVAADKTYQVTGPILEVTESTITVQKGKEKWQLARNKDTKVTGELKVGDKVTIMYTMTAASIETKK